MIKQRTKSSNPISGVLTARTVTHPPRQRIDSTSTVVHADNFIAESSLKDQQEKNSVITNATSKNFIEDSEFLLQASLFLQTAGQQLNNIESSLKSSKYIRKIFNLNIENCDREYAHQVVEAVLNGHDIKRKEVFSVPARLKKSVFSKKGESWPVNGDQPVAKLINHSVDVEKKQVIRTKNNTNTNEKQNSPIESTQEKKPSFRHDSFVQSSQVHEEPLSGSKELISETAVVQTIEKGPIVNETSSKLRNTVPVGVIRKKTTIKNLYTADYDPKEWPKNAVSIKMVSNTPLSNGKNEDDIYPQLKPNKNSLVIQALPSINIKPELSRETFTQVNIPPSEILQKVFSAKKNVSFIEIIYNDNEKYVEEEELGQKSSKRHKYKNIESAKRKSSLNCEKVFQIIKSSDCSSMECIADSRRKFSEKKEPFIVRKQKQFDRGKLDDILNSTIEKLASYIEIPDEFLEKAIDRLWVLGDYLEEIYINTLRGHKQKVRLNFTSLWLHEIIRLIDNEMKNKGRSLNSSSGINSIVQYIISEIECASSVSQQQSCVLAEENGAIQFYCRHDSLFDQALKARKRNQASVFLNPLNLSKIFSEGIVSSVSNDFAGNRIAPSTSESFVKKHSKVKNKYPDVENAEPTLISQILKPSSDNCNDVPTTSSSKLVEGRRNVRIEKLSKSCVTDNLVPEKLHPGKVRSAGFKGGKSISKHTMNLFGQNKLMNADQRQIVIQKLGEEVQKMLSLHEQSNYFDHSSVSNSAVSETEYLRTSAFEKKLSPILSANSRAQIDTAERERETQNRNIKDDFQGCSKLIDCEPDVMPHIEKSSPTEMVSSIISDEDVAYEDDWEEDLITSAKNGNNNQLLMEGKQEEEFISLNNKAAKLSVMEVRGNNSDESRGSIDMFVKKNEETLVSGSEKSLVISGNSDVASKNDTNTSGKKSVELGSSLKNSNLQPTLKSSPESKLVGESVGEDCSKPNNCLLTKKHPDKNTFQPLGSETDVSYYSGHGSVSVNTLSDNAQNSNSGLKKSEIDSEAETVMDLSVLNSEVVETDSKVTMSLHVEENSFKENDCGNIAGCSIAAFPAPSEGYSVCSNDTLEVNECEISNQSEMLSRGSYEESKNSETLNSKDSSPSPNGSDNNSVKSTKLSESCHELAERVFHIEQIKNDLLKALNKPECKSLNTVSRCQSFPVTSGAKGEPKKYASSSALIRESDFVTKISSRPNFTMPKLLASGLREQDKVMNDTDIDGSANLNKVLFQYEHERSNQSCIVLHTKTDFESESSSSEKSHHGGDLGTSKSFSVDSLLSSTECSSNFEVRDRSPTKVFPEVINSQFVIAPSGNESAESLFSHPKQLSSKKNTKRGVGQSENKYENGFFPKFNRDIKTGGTGVTKSFDELSNEILHHLEQEAEFLAQFDSTSSVHKAPSKANGSVDSTKRGTSSLRSRDSEQNFYSQNGNLSSPLELVSDVIDVPSSSSDGSLFDFENLMSKLSENIDDQSNDFSGDNVDEIFSIISSERYKINSSKNFDSSIKDVLLNTNSDLSNCVLERF